jgi:IclR family KDG regulon transcriptional repressor
MSPAFKRVPAVDKCFAILELLAQSKEAMGISDISGKLDLNKSTVFNILHTLMDLNVLENQADGKFVSAPASIFLETWRGNAQSSFRPHMLTWRRSTRKPSFRPS